MRQTNRNAFTLVELLVVIAIIGTLVGLLLPAVQAAREAARSNSCRSNMTQLQKAITQREQSQGSFPGYINFVGPSTEDVRLKNRASWVVTTFPYIEQPALWDSWSRGSTATEAELYSPLEILVCPSDPPDTQDQPVLSYSANAGFIQREQPTATGDVSENAANGVFTDRTRSPTPDTAAVHPQDIRDLPNNQADAEIVMTSAYIGSKGDGLTNTIMVSENLTAHLWGYTGAERIGTSGTPEKKFHFGVCWEDPDLVAGTPPTTEGAYQTDPTFRKINGQRVDNAVLISSFKNDMLPNYGFPSSNHPGGVNIAFCGGNVTFISEEITPQVYAQLMTSNRKGSDLKVGTSPEIHERRMKQPSDGDF